MDIMNQTFFFFFEVMKILLFVYFLMTYENFPQISCTLQQSSLLIKLLQATDPTSQNQLPDNPGAFHP